MFLTEIFGWISTIYQVVFYADAMGIKSVLNCDVKSRVFQCAKLIVKRLLMVIHILYSAAKVEQSAFGANRSRVRCVVVRILLLLLLFTFFLHAQL